MTEQLRVEMREKLDRYLAGTESIADVLSWEASLSLDPDVPADIRSDLDVLALLGEEVERGEREEIEFDGAVLGIVSTTAVELTTPPPRTESTGTPIFMAVSEPAAYTELGGGIRE